MAVASSRGVMWLLLVGLVLAVAAAVAVAAQQQRLTAARQVIAELAAREAAALQELASAKRQAAQAEADHETLARFLRELPHVAHEMHASPGGRKVASLLLNAVVRLLQPKRAVVAVARRSADDEPEQARPLSVAAVSPDGWLPIGSAVSDGGDIDFAVEVQRVMDRRDFEAQPDPARRRPRPEEARCRPDLVAPLVFKEETVGVIAIEAPRRYGPEMKDLVRLIAHIGAASLYTSARYSAINKTANSDGLTGLFNKRFVTLRLAEEIQRALAHTTTLSVFLFDIDNFKHYNDRNGHVEGDRLLRVLARVARESTRADTIFGRFGGEEFLMIFPDTTREQAMVAAENVRLSIAQHEFPAGAQQPLGCVSISGGVAECPQDAADSAAIVRLADEALYAAKRAGRNRVLVFEPRYLGSEHAQEPLADHDGQPETPAVDAAANRRAYEASFAEARRLLADDNLVGALAAARNARRLEPGRPAVAQLVTAIEQCLTDRGEDLILVDEESLVSQGRARRFA